MIYILFIYILISLSFILHSYKNDKFLNCICTYSWSTLMALPFLLQFNSFHFKYREDQAIGIVLIGLSFLLAELFGAKKNKKIEQNFLFKDSLIFLSSVVVCLIQITHLALMPEIPILSYLSSFTSDTYIATLREKSAKLLDISIYLKYLFQMTNVLAPILAILLIKRNKWTAGIFFTFTIFYSISTTAKVMFIVYLVLFLLPIYIRHYLFRKASNFTFLALSIGLFLYGANVYYFTRPTSSSYLEAETDRVRTFTMADAHRVTGNLPLGNSMTSDTVVTQKLKSLFYRAILVPPEVSHMWYTYYPTLSAGFMGFSRLTNENRHPANAVGKWAYETKYPDHFLDSVHAYASIDADIYSKFGIGGIVLISIVVFILILITRDDFSNYESDETKVIRISVISVIALLAPMSSIQAILVPQGLVILILILGIIKMRRSFFQSYKSPQR